MLSCQQVRDLSVASLIGLTSKCLQVRAEEEEEEAKRTKGSKGTKGNRRAAKGGRKGLEKEDVAVTAAKSKGIVEKVDKTMEATAVSAYVGKSGVWEDSIGVTD